MPHHINAAPRVYPFNELALLLLVLRIFANDHDAALTLDNLALFADGFNGRSYFHVCCLLTSSNRSVLAAPGDSTAGQIIGRELDRYLVTGVDADVIHAHFAGNVRQYLMPVGQLYLEHGVGIRFCDNAFNFNNIGLGHAYFSSLFSHERTS